MTDADAIVDKMSSWMTLQKDSAVKLNELAAELEEKQKAINVSKVVRSSVSVGGAAAMATAGVVSVLTGGLAIPFLAGAGALASGVGLVTNMGSDVASVILSNSTMEEAKKISTKMDELNTELMGLMDSLLTKAKGRQQWGKNGSPEDYVMEAILRAMAKPKGLILNKKESLIKLLSELPLEKIFKKNTDLSFLKKSTLEMPLLSDFVTGLVSEELTKVGEKKEHKEVIKQGVTKAATSLGLTVSSKAVRKIGRGAVGLLFSVPELMENCANLEKSETEASRYLREKAGAIQEAYKAMKSELDEIETLCEKLAETKWKKYRKRCLC